MRIVFSQHASMKIMQRNIPRHIVLATTTTPDFSRPSYHFREERYRRFGRRYMKVVTRLEKKTIIIITAHWVVRA